MRYFELTTLFAAILAPQFFLARSLGTDEMAKASAGIALGGVVVAAYKVWKGKDDA